MDTLADLSKSVLGGDDRKTSELTQAAISAGVPARQVLENGLIAGMTTVGERFKAHEMFLPDVLLAARAMRRAVDILQPLLHAEKAPRRDRVVIGTVRGDIHDIGRNLVGIMLRGAGFEVIDLGNDVRPETFVEKATEHSATVIGMSALLTTTMPAMKTVVDLLRAGGMSGNIKTIIGGAPVTPEYAREIGADTYGFDAMSAIEEVKALTATT